VLTEQDEVPFTQLLLLPLHSRPTPDTQHLIHPAAPPTASSPIHFFIPQHKPVPSSPFRRRHLHNGSLVTIHAAQFLCRGRCRSNECCSRGRNSPPRSTPNSCLSCFFSCLPASSVETRDRPRLMDFPREAARRQSGDTREIPPACALQLHLRGRPGKSESAYRAAVHLPHAGERLACPEWALRAVAPPPGCSCRGDTRQERIYRAIDRRDGFIYSRPPKRRRRMSSPEE